MEMLNYFIILNVTENAEFEVIKASYKALAKKYHPDNTFLSKEDTEKQMTLINEAYQVLSNEKTRMEYVEKLHAERKNYAASECYSDNENGSMKEETKEKHANSDIADNPIWESYDSVQEYNPSNYSDKFSVFDCIIVVVIIISIICCILYFAPNVLKNTCYDILSEFKKIINTFL